MVGEVVDSWGAYPSGDGKVVWFEIADGEDEYAGESEASDPANADGPGAVEVELLNVPLLMHAAWQEHAAALLRELLLIRLDEDDDAIESHAAASDALNVLFEQIPAPDLGDHPEAIMAAATEPSVSRTRIMLRIPVVLDAALRGARLRTRGGRRHGGGRPAAVTADPARAPDPAALALRPDPRPARRGAPARPWASPTDALPPVDRRRPGAGTRPS